MVICGEMHLLEKNISSHMYVRAKSFFPFLWGVKSLSVMRYYSETLINLR